MKTVFISLLLAIVPAARADVPAQLATQLQSGLTRGTALAIVAPGAQDQLITTGDVRSPDELLEIGSISKSFTAIVAAELSLEGRLDLGAPLSHYLHELAGTYAGTITAQELGTHTARLPDSYTDSSGSLSTVETPDEVIAFLHDFTPVIPAGARSYSNLGFATLGVLIARITGESLRENVSQRIFAPLGMLDSLEIGLTAPSGLLQGYGVALDPLPFRPFGDPECAAGGVASTLHDLLLFLKANLSPDPASELGQATALSQKLGLGWDSLPGVTPLWKNGAMDAGFSSLIEFDPGRKSGVVVIANTMDALTTVDLGKELLGDKSWAYADLPSPSSFVAQVTGQYSSADGSIAISVFPVADAYLGIQQLAPKPPAGTPAGWYRVRLMTPDLSTYWIDNGLSFSGKLVFQPGSGATYFAPLGPDSTGEPQYRAVALLKAP